MEIETINNALGELGLITNTGVAVVTIVIIHLLKPIFKQYKQELALHLMPILLPFISVFFLSDNLIYDLSKYDFITWFRESLFAVASTYILYELFWKKFIEKKN